MNRHQHLSVAGTSQLTLDFEPGLLERHPTAMDVIRHVAYAHRKPIKALAADMDMSQSTLSRKLGADPDDPRRFSVDDLERFVVASGDVTVIQYLAAKYLQSDESRRSHAVQAAEHLLRELAAILPSLKSD